MPICSACGLLSPEDASFCSRCGQPLDAGDEGERRRLVTVLFCDLVGSTQLGEHLDPEILRQVQGRYFAAATSALRRHGGQVEKFIGDAVMCVFGLPRTHEDDAARGCRAALDFLEELEVLNQVLEAEWDVRLGVRMGVNTGEVVAGDPARGQALATGDTVNTAARLEQAAGPGEVLIGELTYRLAAGSVQVESREPITAKGKAELLPCYLLLTAGGVGMSPAKVTSSALVGREPELTRLRVEFENAVASSNASLLVIVGEAGIGKSRLVAELVDTIAGESRILSGRCVSYGEGITYWPLREMVESLVGDDDGALVDRLAADPSAAWVASRLLRVVGRADGLLTREETFEAVPRFFRALAAEAPLLVVVEDLHWAEPTLLDLLELLPGRLEGTPLLLVGTARSDLLEERPALADRAMRLAPLNALAAASLLEGGAELDAERRANLLAAAGGNPLFLHQLRAAAEHGGLDGLPPDLRALLGARLDRLSPSERETLEMASVVGREFWPGALAALLPPAVAGELHTLLARLIRLEFIDPGRADAPRADSAPGGLSGMFGSEGRHSFRHALIEATAYRSLPKARAAELHEHFAAFLEESGARATERSPIVAWHLERAARLRFELHPGELAPRAARRAADLLEEEGRRALARDEPLAAANLFTRAGVLAPDRSSTRAALEEALTRSQADSGADADAVVADAGELTPGDKLGGYEIETLAGQGGMGVVYRARDARLGRAVAVKVISPALARDQSFRKRFQRESRLAAQIEHPNVIPVYRAGEQEGRLFIAMRYVEGTDLATLVAAQGALEPHRAARLLEQVARALDAAHARGLVHRDVKPGNVLIGAGSGHGDERVYLTDFGLSLERSAAAGLTRTGQWVGTPAYVAPEQIRAAPVDARTDVYALGAVLYHCLTGVVPFPATSEFEMLAAHLDVSPPRPSSVASVSPAFDPIVAKAMAKDPGARFQSAGDLGRAIVAATRGEPIPLIDRSVATGLAAPQAPAPSLGRPRTSAAPRSSFFRRRMVAAAAAIALAGAGAALIVALTGREAASPGPPGEAAPTGANPAGRIEGPPVRVERPPERLAAVGGYVWALTKDPGRLTRIDLESRRVEYFPAPIDLGGGLYPDIAGGLGSLWVTHSTASVGGIDRIEPTSVEAIERIPLPFANALAVNDDAVWATTTRPPGSAVERGTLARIDPSGNRLDGSPLPIGRDPADVAVGHGSVWVADRARNTVLRVDPRTLRILARVSVGRGPAVIAVGPGVVWTANAEDRTLSRINPARNEVMGAPLVLGKEIQDVVATSEALWVAAADGTVTRLDLRTGENVGSPIAVGRAPLSLVWDGKRLWVASVSDQTLQAIQPGR
jgi:class 3 adenylate cyclase/streptogramin lyase/predicted Ser/Thr protein kinase